MYYLVVDLEMGEVDAKDRPRLEGMAKEIIQLGAVLVSPELEIVDEFSAYARPRIGYVSHYIRKITGITNERLKTAPRIETVIEEWNSWLGDREITAMSWSDSDFRQLRQEIKVKKIRADAVEKLFPGWVDLQMDFCRAVGLKERCSLAEALRLCHIDMVGQEHDGLCDARNTARVFIKVFKRKDVGLSLTPIRGKKSQSTRKKEKGWTPARVFYALRHGKKEALGDGFEKSRFEKRMR